MKLTPEDPRLTAYVLEELEPAEQDAVKRSLREDPALHAEARALCAAARRLVDTLQPAGPVGLTCEQRAAVEAALGGEAAAPSGLDEVPAPDFAEPASDAPAPNVVPLRSFWRTWGPALGGLAAALVIGWGFWPKPTTPMTLAKRQGQTAPSSQPDLAKPATPVPAPGTVPAPQGGSLDLARQAPPPASPPPAPSTPKPKMDRLMMERYGLLPPEGNRPAPPPAGPSTPATPAPAPRPQPVSPERLMMERYGLMPGNTAPTTPRRLGAPMMDPGHGQPAPSFRREPALRRERSLPLPGRFAGESYARPPESPFLDTRQNPLSTFGLEVDTASYAIIRRFVTAGAKPPPDAVRIEELINYFPYDYPEPTGADPLAVHLEVAGCPWAPEHRLVRIGLKAREVAAAARPACNLVFLIDVSGSMSPQNKLPLLRQALLMLTERLHADDRVAIVTYASGAELALSSTSGQYKGLIRQVLNELRAGGSTHGSAGIQMAYQQAREHFLEGGVNRVILCTDGDFNVGITDRTSLIRLISDEARDGVFLTALGLGDGNYRDTTMEALADHGNGHYAYLDRLTEAYKVLVQELSSTLVPVAKDVKLQVEFNPAKVRAYRLIGYADRRLQAEDFNDDCKDAGEIGAGHTVTALYEIVPPGVAYRPPRVDPLKYQRPATTPEPNPEPDIRENAAPSNELLTVKLRWKAPDAKTSQRREFSLVDPETKLEAASTDFRFAAAVAAYGMILAESPWRGEFALDDVTRLALGALGRDRDGYRADFLELVKATKRIGWFRRRAPEPVF